MPPGPLTPTDTLCRGEESCALLESAFNASVRGGHKHDDFEIRHRRWNAGEVIVDRMSFSASFGYDSGPVASWHVLRPHKGVAETTFGATTRAVLPGTAAVTQVDTPCTGVNVELDAVVVGLDVGLLQHVLGPDNPVGRVLAPENLREITGAQLELWDRTVGTVVHDLLGDPEVGTESLAGRQAKRLLAATALMLFTLETDVRSRAGERDGTPETLRRATAFADAYADQDIGLADLAIAARVTPRALQYAFRRHLGTTPETYLRMIRLEHAHRQLLAADPHLETVGVIAARWGWFHQGRFAAAYRDQYGRSPLDTLRS